MTKCRKDKGLEYQSSKISKGQECKKYEVFKYSFEQKNTKSGKSIKKVKSAKAPNTNES